MEEGTIVKWMKAEGESIEAGDVVCDIQTDKAVVSMEADEEGVLAKIIKGSDSGSIKVGELIAVVAEDGEDWKVVAATGGGDDDAADASGEVLCDIQTDKAVVSMECDDDGVVAKILIEEGVAGVQVGTLIALIVEEGQDWKDVAIPAQEGQESSPAVSASAPASPAPASTPSPAPPSPTNTFPLPSQTGPAASLLLSQYGLDPSKISGSGPKGNL